MKLKDKSNMSNTSVLILAGGESSRMDHPKAWLPFDDKHNFLENLVAVYHRLGCQEIIVVLNSHFAKGKWEEHVKSLSHMCRFVFNDYPARGRSYSILLGLRNLEDHDRLFIQNVDNPFTEYELLKSMISALGNKEGCIPVVKGKKGHPVMISSESSHALLEIEESSFHLRQALGELDITELDWKNNQILVNINDASDYDNYFLGNSVMQSTGP